MARFQSGYGLSDFGWIIRNSTYIIILINPYAIPPGDPIFTSLRTLSRHFSTGVPSDNPAKSVSRGFSATRGPAAGDKVEERYRV